MVQVDRGFSKTSATHIYIGEEMYSLHGLNPQSKRGAWLVKSCLYECIYLKLASELACVCRREKLCYNLSIFSFVVPMPVSSS